MGASSVGAQNSATVSMSFSGLEDLGPDYVYEGWLIVDGAPVTAGRFSVDADGNPSVGEFAVNADAAVNAVKYVLTIEPVVGDDPGPAATHILAGDIENSAADLSVADGAALGTDFTSATGAFILNTPSTANTDDDFAQGIWWLDPAAGPGPTLSLPELPAGWAYEGWVVVDGAPISTGRFLDGTAPDDDGAGPTGGPDGFPPFPGQDFINPAVQVNGGTAVISVEPTPDNSPAPFTLKPLVGGIPADLAIGTTSPMSNNADATNPTGRITITAG